MRRTLIAAAAVGALVLASSLTSAQPAQALAASMTANYASTTGTFLDTKVLNGAEGGYRFLTSSPQTLTSQLDNYVASGVDMVRFDHLFDTDFYGVLVGSAPNYTYDFTRLDALIVPFLQRGIRPLMALSFMPDQLQTDGGRYSPPNNMTHWQNLVKATVQHYKDLGYTGLYWEVWNEPNAGSLNNGTVTFWSGTTAEFNSLYTSTVQGVRAIDATAKVGGSADDNANGTYLPALLNHIVANPTVPLDFVSFHAYEGYGTTDWSGVDTVQGLLTARGLTGKEIFVSEWNNALGGAPAGDGNINATYLARKMYLAYEKPNLSRVFIFAPPKVGTRPRTPMTETAGSSRCAIT